ncbi:PLP-dependent transferase [Cubamyces lactineus]|nr:PLP-dependent transferase [Cubamyces lactineus]
MPIRSLTPSEGETYDASQKPPPFGHALKHYFAFDEDFVNLNHGSYGSLPLPVLFSAAQMGYEIERNPDLFHRLKVKPLLDKARESVAKLIEAETDEVVLVPNATHALNTVLRNFEWREGDVIIGATTTYGAVTNTIRYLADRSEQPRPEAVAVTYEFPLTHAQILDIFRAKLREAKQQRLNTPFTDVPPLSPWHDARAENAQGNKIVAVIDSITANPGALMPWQEMVRVCREEGVWTVIDAAHSIGQEPDINLTESKPDFWLSNCHKWLYAKRGCAVLYVPRRTQHIINSSIPTAFAYVSPGSPEAKVKGTNFATQHDCKSHETCCTASDTPERRTTRPCSPSGPTSFATIKSNVALPLPAERTPGKPEIYTPERLKKIDLYLREKLLLEWKTYAAHYFHAGRWWCRCSAQVFNEVSDFAYLGNAFNAVCKEIEETILVDRSG